MTIDTSKTYTATVKTDVGTFVITLDAKHAPKTVNNFVFLAEQKFFNCIIFHRVIPGFMDQSGDPTGTGSGRARATSSPTSSPPRRRRSTRSGRWPWPTTRAPPTPTAASSSSSPGQKARPCLRTTSSSGPGDLGDERGHKINADGNSDASANGVAAQGHPPDPVGLHLVLVGPACPGQPAGTVRHSPDRRTTMTVELPAADGSSASAESSRASPPCSSTRPSATPPPWSTSQGDDDHRPRPPGGAPRTVNSFVFLARYHYFDGIVFHRDHPRLRAPGRRPHRHRHRRARLPVRRRAARPGALRARARWPWPTPGPNTNGSQFFVISGPDGMRLPPSYSLFGKVVSGLDTVAAIDAVGSSSGQAQGEGHHRVGDHRRVGLKRPEGSPVGPSGEAGRGAGLVGQGVEPGGLAAHEDLGRRPVPTGARRRRGHG